MILMFWQNTRRGQKFQMITNVIEWERIPQGQASIFKQLWLCLSIYCYFFLKKLRIWSESNLIDTTIIGRNSNSTTVCHYDLWVIRKKGARKRGQI